MGSIAEERSSLEYGLLEAADSKEYTGDGSVDIQGRPVIKKKTGGWKACPFILGTECCERLAYYGIATNLVTYLTNKMHEGNVASATIVNTWQGTCYLTPLIGAVLADAYWGRYWTITGFSTVYLIGMCVLALSASVPSLKPPMCRGSTCPEATSVQYMVFFSGLYMVALGTGGIKPCVSSFGADQFDNTDAVEQIRKGSFFNWFYFSINIGALISSSLIVWIQDSVGWGLGFGIPSLFMAVAIVSFLLGTPLYRFQVPGGSPLTRILQVLVASMRKWKVRVPLDGKLLHETPLAGQSAIRGSRKLCHSNELRCLDKAAVRTESDAGRSTAWRLCTLTQVEELKILVRMLPIWATGIVFSAVYAQMSTMFVEQGSAMDTRVGSGSFRLPPASLSTFDVVSVIFWVPVYDRLIVPAARRITGRERGFSELQRMGVGLLLSAMCMAAAAVVEGARLRRVVGGAGPTSILWQVPQYFLLGAAEVFFFVGQLEFFYDQSPDAMRSLCNALSLLTTSLGIYLSSLLLAAVTALTTRGGARGWIPDDLNQGHLDYYFWLLAALSLLNLFVYSFCSLNYTSKKASS